jgi:nucleoside-diphosphate-sugar epimerase
VAKYLLIGGGGFVGVNISAALREKGDDVVVMDNLTYSQDENIGYLESLGVEIKNGDVRDLDGLRREISGGFDGVFHLASVVGIKHYLSSTRNLIDVNINGAVNVADVCAESGIKVLFTSTSEVLGRNTAIPWNENADRVYGAPDVDRWAYGVSKGLAEQIFNVAVRTAGLKMIITRYFNIYGPYQRPYFVISRSIQKLLLGESPEVYDSGNQTRCFTYIDEAVQATIGLMESEEALGKTFHIGSQFEYSVSEAVEVCKAVVGREDLGSSVVETEKMYGSVYEDIERRVPSVEKIRDAIGWEAKIDLSEGVKKFSDWAKGSRWWLSLDV